MTDLHERFEDFGDVEPPDLWDRIERMAATTAVRPSRRWSPVAAAVTAAAVVLLLIGGVTWLLRGDSRDSVVDQPAPTLVVPELDASPTPTNAPVAPDVPVLSDSEAPETFAPSPPEGFEPPPDEFPPSMTTVPDVIGVEDWRDARLILETAGFVVVVELLFEIPEQREGPNVEAGIAHVDPWPGDEIVAGSVVTLTIYADPVESWDLTGEKPQGTWTTVTDDDSLASNCVNGGIDVAPDGTVWAGCTDGLSRFDGASWTVVRDDVVCDSLTVGASGEVWILACNSDADLTVLRFEDGIWTTYMTVAAGAIAVGPDGTVWLAAGSIWRLEGDQFVQMTDDETGPSLWEVTVGGDGVVWAAGPEGGLWRFDGAWTEVPAGRGVEAIAADSTSGLWAGYDRASFYDGSSFTDMGLAGSFITAWAFAPEGTVWAVSEFSGAFRFDGNGWAHYTTADGLASDNLTSVAVAPDGTVWFGTADAGISRFLPDQ